MAKSNEIEEWRRPTNGQAGTYPSGKRYSGVKAVNTTCLCVDEKSLGKLSTTGKEEQGRKIAPTIEEVENGAIITVRDGGYEEIETNKGMDKE